MTRQLLYFLLSLHTAAVFSQQKSRQLAFDSAPLDRAINTIEQVFEVRYSYIDSVVQPRKLTLKPSRYTLEEVNAAIRNQCSLEVVPIDSHYYSIFPQSEPIRRYELREILVSNFMVAGIDKKTSSVQLHPQRIKILPGVTDADVMRSLQQLPGVKSPNETASGLHIRGGTPDQNLILWDGIRIVHPGHLFGMIAPFNPNINQTVQYYNKATDAAFGQSVSSVIAVETDRKVGERLQADAGLNLLNADACLQLPLYKKQLGLQLAARKSITQWWRSPTFDALAEKVFANSNFTDFGSDDNFGFEDYAAKLVYNPAQHTQFFLSGIFIDNSLQYRTRPTAGSYTGQNLGIRNYGYSLGWSQTYFSKWKQQLSWHFSDYDFDYEKQRNFSAEDFEAFRKRNRMVDSGLKLSLTYEHDRHLETELGYEALGNDSSHEINAVNEGFYFNLDQQHFFSLTHSVFGQVKYQWSSWDFKAGLRYNAFIKLHEARLEPRLLVQRKMGKKFVWQASYEARSQQTAQVREGVANDLSLENYVWIAANGVQFPMQYGAQYASGLLWKSHGWLIDGEMYYKTLQGITARSYGFLQAFENEAKKGNGYTKGFDLLLQHQGSRGRFWATYTYQDSQNRYEGINNEQYFPISSNLTHALSVSGLKKWDRFSITAGWFWHSGKPFSALDADGHVTGYNSQKLPDYHRLDLSGQYHFDWTAQIKGKAGFSISNVYNRTVVISREYEKQYQSVNAILSPAAYSTKDYFSQGFTPNVFVRFLW